MCDVCANKVKLKLELELYETYNLISQICPNDN